MLLAVCCTCHSRHTSRGLFAPALALTSTHTWLAGFSVLPPAACHTFNTSPSPNASHTAARHQVGYVSPDLFTHSVSYFVEAPLLHHSGSRVALYVYSCVAKADAKTLRLQQQVSAAQAAVLCFCLLVGATLHATAASPRAANKQRVGCSSAVGGFEAALVCWRPHAACWSVCTMAP